MKYFDIIKNGKDNRVLKPYFSKEDIKFCSVPVPPINSHKDGVFEFTEEQKSKYGQSQTHPSIVYIPTGFNGHKWWLAATPYPKSTGIFDNPCIYYGDEDDEGNPPLIFTPIKGVANGKYTMVNNPIVKVSNTTTTNSDPDLFFDEKNNKLCLISRENTYGFAYYYQESLDGQSWTPRLDKDEYIIKLGDGMPTELVSPAIIIKDGINAIYGLKGVGYLSGELSVNEGINKGITIYNGSFEPKGMNIVDKASILGKMEFHPWHMDICFYNNKYYLLFCGINRQANRQGLMYLAESEDGLDFKVFARPICPLNYSYYRPSFYIADDKIVIYGCTEGGAPTDALEYPKAEQDVPVDGRAIFRVIGNFTDLINTLKDDIITT